MTDGVAGDPHLLLLMTVLAQAFFAFVSGHLVAFSFLSAGHFTLSLEVNIDYVRCKEFRNCLLHFLHEHLCGLESGNLVFGDNNGGVLRDVAGSLLRTYLDDEAAETAEVNILAVSE